MTKSIQEIRDNLQFGTFSSANDADWQIIQYMIDLCDAIRVSEGIMNRMGRDMLDIERRIAQLAERIDRLEAKQ